MSESIPGAGAGAGARRGRAEGAQSTLTIENIKGRNGAREIKRMEVLACIRHEMEISLDVRKKMGPITIDKMVQTTLRGTADILYMQITFAKLFDSRRMERESSNINIWPPSPKPSRKDL
jgi:hypothetical protein